MAVKIRLRRMGAHKKPFYRIVVADSRSPRDGRFIEELGYYNPLTDPATVKINAEKARKWLATGAQPTDTVRALFNKEGISKPAKDEIMAADVLSEPAVDAQSQSLADTWDSLITISEESVQSELTEDGSSTSEGDESKSMKDES